MQTSDMQDATVGAIAGLAARSPEWAAIHAVLRAQGQAAPMTATDVAARLGVDDATARASFALLADSIVIGRGAALARHDNEDVGVYARGEFITAIPREMLLAWLALGLVELEPDDRPGPVRRYVAAGRCLGDEGDVDGCNLDPDLSERERRLGFTPGGPEARTLRALRDQFVAASTDPGGEAFQDLVRVRDRLGADLFLPLYDLLARGRGHEEIERAHNLPTRSAKTILAIAVRLVARDRGLLQ